MSENIEPFLKDFLEIQSKCELTETSESQVFKMLAVLDSKYKDNIQYFFNIDGLICNLGADHRYKKIIKYSICRLKEKKKKYNISKVNYDLGNCIYVLAELENGYQHNIENLIDDKSYNNARSYFSEIPFSFNNIEYSCALTNSANILEKYGRNYEAIYLYDKVLKVNPRFGMALGNKARAMEYYLALSPYKSFKIMHYIVELFSKALLDESLDKFGGANVYKFFEHRVSVISNYLRDNGQLKNENAVTRPKSMSPYLIFCLNHNLFLNYDFGHYYDKHSIRDDFFPNFVEQMTELKNHNSIMSDRVYFSFQVFNQILESYTTARLKFFQATTKKYKSIDQLVSYTYAYDYTSHSYKYGLLKSIFCELYNCLDKIAHLIFYYYLGFDSSKKEIYFKSLLCDDFKEVVISKNNYQLLALRSLALDFDTDQQYHYLNKIRNRITHSFLNIHSGISYNENFSDYEITEDLLLDAVNELFLILKAAIMYAVIAISSNDDVKGKFVSMPVTKERDIFY